MHDHFTITTAPDYEYETHDESTWRFHTPPILDSKWQERLISIAGVNPHGQPNLKIVWGGTEKSDKSESGKDLKYHAGYTSIDVEGYRYSEDGVTKFTTELEGIPETVFVVPAIQQLELGLLRFVIEKWVSPETLAEQHRFEHRYALGDIDPTLRQFPRQGVYDTYFIVENAEGKFRVIDDDILAFIKYKWHFDQKPFAEREQLRTDYLEKEAAAKTKVYEERLLAAFEGDLKLPKEEQDRRDEYWAKHHDYVESESRRLATA